MGNTITSMMVADQMTSYRQSIQMARHMIQYYRIQEHAEELRMTDHVNDCNAALSELVNRYLHQPQPQYASTFDGTLLDTPHCIPTDLRNQMLDMIRKRQQYANRLRNRKANLRKCDLIESSLECMDSQMRLAMTVSQLQQTVEFCQRIHLVQTSFQRLETTSVPNKITSIDSQLSQVLDQLGNALGIVDESQQAVDQQERRDAEREIERLELGLVRQSEQRTDSMLLDAPDVPLARAPAAASARSASLFSANPAGSAAAGGSGTTMADLAPTACPLSSGLAFVQDQEQHEATRAADKPAPSALGDTEEKHHEPAVRKKEPTTRVLRDVPIDPDLWNLPDEEQYQTQRLRNLFQFVAHR